MRYLTIAAVLLLCGCTDAQISGLQAIGAKHRVELWSGGQRVREWTSTGKVMSEEHSDGYLFRDSETQSLVRVSGSVVVTPIE